MHTYLVEVYNPCHTCGGRGEYRIRACRLDKKTEDTGAYRDWLSPEMVRYTIVDAPNINHACQSMLTMGKLEGKQVVIDWDW